MKKLLVLLLLVAPSLVLKANADSILSADLSSFAVLGASAVTNVPTSTVVGSVGVSPGSAITGFNSSPGVAVSDPQVTQGTVQATTAVAEQAQNDLTIAKTTLSSLGAGTLLSSDLAGLTLFPGVYTLPAGVSNLTGTLTLDGQGNANAAWVFQVASTLITSPGSVVDVINTGSGAGLYWNVGSSATLDTTTSFQGNILGLASVTLNTGATIGCGRALANTGAVTMDMNTIGFGCDAGTGGEGSNGFSGGLTYVETPEGPVATILPVVPVGESGGGGDNGGGGSPVPEPATLFLMGTGLAGIVARSRKKRKLNVGQ